MKLFQNRKTVLGLAGLLLLLAAWFGVPLCGKTGLGMSSVPAVAVESKRAAPPAPAGASALAPANSRSHVLGTAVAAVGRNRPPVQALPDDDGQISAPALKQIAALQQAKASRTATQEKLDSQLIYAAKMEQGESIAEGIPVQQIDLDHDSAGRILVDITAEVTAGLLGRIHDLGGSVLNSFVQFHAIRAGLPVAAIETLAARAEVKFIEPAARAICNTGSVNSEGDNAHGAAPARITFGADGTGVKVGVLSDSVDYLSNSQSLGDLPADLITLPGQSGVPGSGEGTAMLEIVHDLAPGSKLYFATAFSSIASFAQNILNLRSNGCDIIVDDVYYFNESPFQDGLIAKSVNSVTAGGALYFSSAGNSGSVDRGTAGTWEGDFMDGGATASPLEAGRIHTFVAGTDYNTVGTGGSSLRVDLFWADPLGASTNDYDVYVLNSSGTSVVSSSTSRQNGSQDPYESIGTLASGNRIVIVKYSGTGRFLHLETGRGRLVINTPGNTKGHACATNSFCVAAVAAANAGGGTNAFAGGAQDPVETFSSDGPRRVFFQADGSAITPGNFSSSGGAVRQKPDIAAADGVVTTLPSGSGLNPFYGTSAAAPHAGAVAALLKSYNPALTASQYRSILTNTALDIMAAGVDRDSGSGIVMVPAALPSAAPDSLQILSGNVNMFGPVGGPFSPSPQNISLTNISVDALNWSLTKTSSWLNASPAAGTLSGGAQVNVSLSPAAAANSLAVGTYTTVVQFSNQTTHVAKARDVTIQVLPLLLVSPAHGFSASGSVGGPFDVTSMNYALTNLGASTLNWGIVNTSAWLTVSSSGGPLASGASTSLVIGLGAAANALAVGDYTSVVVVTNSAGSNLNLAFTLQIRLSLVPNGGFETGDFTGWTFSGTGGTYNFVDGSGTYIAPHGGAYCALFGESGALAYLSENLPTVPGQTYLLSFWLNNPTAGSNRSGKREQFQVNWAGVTITNLSNPGVMGWTGFSFLVTATGTNTTLQFAVRNDPDYFGLDDVSVIPASPPTMVLPPADQTILSGSNAVFSASAAGGEPLVYQWRKNGINLANGGGISGVTTNVLTLAGVTTNSAGNYSLFVTNDYGAVTSSVAALTVVLPPAITSSTLTNRTVECGKNTNTFALTTAGTAPLSVQWSLDSVLVAGATNSSFSLTNLSLPGHTVAVTVTNLYGSTTNNAVVTVLDLLAPVITLNGGNPVYVELGDTFADPGATANDACAGSVAVIASGTVDTNAVGTNTLTYTAGDGDGNTNLAIRIVIVRDTMPPAVLWSFTNLTLVADANCSALMTNVTGTNFILAADLSGALTITQSPTNNDILQIGTNVVVITVADASDNKSFSTNQIIVRDLTPPNLVLNGGALMTNEVGAAFADPGAVSSDTCSGVVLLMTNGFVDINLVGTNYLSYAATDASGNTNQVVRTVIVRDATPPAILWSFSHLILAADTNCSAVMPDVTGPNFILATDLSGVSTITQSPTNGAILQTGTNVVILTVTDAFANTAYSTNAMVVQNQTPPVITLNGGNPVYVELGGLFADSGATADDACAGSVAVIASGTVDPHAVGTNTLTYTAGDGSGNTNTAIRTVIVRDTTSPAVLWSFTHLTLAADTNCSVVMPDVTGTNFILATDLSGVPTITQSPTNGAVLFLGTNVVVLTVTDASTNTAYSTNSIVVQDQTPPVITLNGGNPVYVELGGLFADSGATANDACAGSVAVIASGTVDPHAVGTNTLSYTAGDGNGNTNLAIRTVIVLDPTPEITGVVVVSNGVVNLSFSGAPGSTCILETTANLFPASWLPIFTNTLGTNGVWQFSDTAASNFPQQFYRLRALTEKM